MAAITFMPPGSIADLRCKRVADAPFGTKAHVYSAAWNSCLFRPFGNRHGFSVMFNNFISRVVSILGYLSCPPAIFGAVVSVIVDSVQRVRCSWSMPHVSNEILKGLPSVAYTNASAAISCVSMVFWSSAPVVHVNPCSMLRRFSVSVSNCATSLARLSDTFFLCISELATFANKLCSAVAATKPELLMLVSGWRFTLANNQPLSKTLASQINLLSHKLLFVRSMPNYIGLSTDPIFLFWQRQRKE